MSLLLANQGAGAAYTIPAATGVYTLSGQAAALRADRRLAAAQGTYSLTGFAAGLQRAARLVAAQGTYNLTGQAAALTHAARLLAQQGTYGLTGFAAGLAAARVLLAEHGVYLLTGFDAELIYTPAVAAARVPDGGGGSTGFFEVTAKDLAIAEEAIAEALARLAPPAPVIAPASSLPATLTTSPSNEGVGPGGDAAARARLAEIQTGVDQARELAGAVIDQAREEARRLEVEAQAQARERRLIYAALMTAIVAADDD